MTAPLDKPAGDAKTARRGNEPADPVSQVRPAAAARASARLPYVLVGIGSALGGVARYAAGLVIAAHLGAYLPWGTMLVNLTGSALIGLFATLTGPDGRFYVPPLGRQFVMVGFCGGYTTFSSFSLQTLNLLQGGHVVRAGANLTVSLVLCLAGVWVGHTAAAVLNA